MHTVVWKEILNGRYHFGDLGMDGLMVLKFILKK
jgi:hypothetical protein